ncbi:hypothetical protein KFK09_008638 [Dendrobium nobile]|uniref:Uncharacterized protein n=1 Tax=Dendrobium nobile TaxID=94219 RepID=A0A8T3BLN8_DENNO|nr:hypothetical protein KFK09_008638 [Dendrobium nobile]
MKDPFEAAYEEEDSPPASPPPLPEEEAPTMEGEDEEVAPGSHPSAAAPSNVANASTPAIGGKGKEDEEEEDEENMDVELRKFSSTGDPDKMAKMQIVMRERKESGPIRPCHIREACRRLKLEGKVPRRSVRRLFR